MVADPGVAEDDLDQDLPRDDQAEGDREVGDDGQERIARRVPNDPPGGEALGPGHQDEVLVHGGDHLVAHRHDESGDRGQDDRGRGQDRMADDAADIGPVQPGGDGVDVVPEQAREPPEHGAGLPEHEDQHQGEEEVGHRLEEGGRRHQPVDPRSAAPGHQGADDGAGGEAHDGRNAEEAKCPRQVGEDEAGHRRVLGP